MGGIKIFYIVLDVLGRDYDMVHVEASNEEQACAKAVNHFRTATGITPTISGVSLALRQKRQQYCCPQAIL